MLSINEIFFSLQGESTQAGRPCVFVRLAGCPLRCTWCDTAYAFNEGKVFSFAEILGRVREFNCPLVEVTGGEPLAQKNCIPFLQELVNQNFEVMLETSGALDIKEVPPKVRIIMDVKAPGSGEEKRNLWSNLEHLKPGMDEIKFIVKDEKDFAYTQKICADHNLLGRFTVLVSGVAGELASPTLADWILKSQQPFRFQHQLHKFIWPEKERGF